MYNYTRQEAADKLWISTRSIDRYVKAWKIRSKKEWKIVYLNSDDLNNFSWENKWEVIVRQKPRYKATSLTHTTTEVRASYNNTSSWLWEVYEDLKQQIQTKDRLITELGIRVWQAEEIAKNSVSLIDYKKSQFLLEESKSNLNQAIIDLESEKEGLQKELKYQKTNNIIMLLALVALFAIAGTLFLLKI